MTSKRTKTILLSCGVIATIACLCLMAMALSGVGVGFVWPFEGPFSQPTPMVTVFPTAAVEGQLPSSMLESMREIEEQVVELRGLPAPEVIERELISPEELKKIVVEDFFAEYTDQDAAEDRRALSFLGLLPEAFDLKQLYHSLYSEQIAGFYDDQTGLMYVVAGAGFGGSEKLTYAHEFTHVLQDHTWGLNEGLGLNEGACEADSERCAAVQAVIEGDATLTELLWFQTHASRQDYEDLMGAMDELQTPILDSAPPYIQADLYFPYEKGLTFVQALYDQGGYAALDAAYGNLPVSTEQILHPERYPDDLPIEVVLADLTPTLGDGWALFDQNVMGEWYTFLILNKGYDPARQLSERQAMRAAEGWGGDAYALYVNDSTEELLFVMDAVWDTAQDATEFADAFRRYADLRWEREEGDAEGLSTWSGDTESVAFWHSEDRTVWVMAPSQALVEAALGALQ